MTYRVEVRKDNGHLILFCKEWLTPEDDGRYLWSKVLPKIDEAALRLILEHDGWVFVGDPIHAEEGWVVDVEPTY